MRKVCIASLAILVAMAIVPAAPAQVPGEVQGLLCDAGAGGVPLSLLSGTHAGTSVYSAPGADPNVHVFSFCGAEGDDIDFLVDNTNTPSDLWACVTATPADPCDPPFYNAILSDLGGDDEVGCSVTHFFGCPAGQAPLPADSGDGIYYIRVGTWSQPGGYSGTLTVNGSDVLILPA